MNETLRVIKNRYSCRAFDDRRIDAELLKMVAEAGIQSPSGMNTQRWHIVVVSDKSLIDELESAGLSAINVLPDKSISERIKSRGGKLFYNAQAFIALATEASGQEPSLLDCGIAVENMTIAAASLGLASCICGLASFAFQGGREAHFNEKLRFPPGYQFAMSILLGYEKAPGKPHEPNPAKITYIE